MWVDHRHRAWRFIFFSCNGQYLSLCGLSSQTVKCVNVLEHRGIPGVVCKENLLLLYAIAIKHLLVLLHTSKFKFNFLK